ncbi:Protein of unknown function [Jhaorihella thermophila]|uniref:Tll0287-like domain-containing protein n=2 Tax=Jhaorihella thermophila TaxID=488547 RepID=A0A1H5X322_9RHOB|nr:Protein of unknown function [Jhaorihella thermophila]
MTMKRDFSIALLAAMLCAGAASAQDKAGLVEEAKTLIQQFGGTLKAELQAAMKEKGPVHAIEVCNTRAPEIAARISADSGWSVGRSSHRLRNPANAPDAYTAAAIEEFLKRQDAGEKPDTLVKAEIVEEDGHKVFRMVKAIPTGGVCLNCHGGDQVKPEVEAALARLYPQDRARGFRSGEMRGVFTLSRRLD